MAEESTRIFYNNSGQHDMNKNEILNVLQDRKIHNLTTPVDVILSCYDKRHGQDEDEEFSETAEMRSEILETIVHINRFIIRNFCEKRTAYFGWFNYLLQFIQTDHGGTKYVVEYRNVQNHIFHLSLQHAIKLSDALLSNNNNDNDNSHIEKFSLADTFFNVEAFQIIWNALLETGVPIINMSPYFSVTTRDDGSDNNNNNNDNINFTGLSTNISVKQLDFNGSGLSSQNWKNLFISLEGNKGLKKLIIADYEYLDKKTIACLKKMLRKNITLIDVEIDLHYDRDRQQDINNVITVETKFNRKWNQYITEREEAEEEKNNSTSTTPPPPPLPAHLAAAAAAAERKRRYKMRCLLHAFQNKSVMHDTILFHILSESPVLLIDDEVQQNLNQVFRNNKKKRPRL